MIITSRTNPKVTFACSLREKKFRDNERKFLIDGYKLFCEAVNSKIEITDVFCTEKWEEKVKKLLPDVEPYVINDSVLSKISDEKSPDGIICVAKYIDKLHFFNKIYKEEDFASCKKRFILSSVRDPGNVGTIIRTACAMGIDEVVLSSDCADIYNPKTVRATMGTLFKQSVVYTESLCDAINQFRKNGVKVYSAMLDETATSIVDLECNDSVSFVVGNEGHGIDEEVAKASTGKVYIPMSNGVESLNVSSAATIFLWKTALSSAVFKKGN